MGVRVPGDVRRELFGGRGEVTVWSLLPALPGLGPFSAALACELSPGGTVGAHRQERDVELVLGVSGTGRARVNGVFHPIEPRAVVPLPLGAVLSIENDSSTEPLVYWIIKATPPAAP